MLRDIYGPVQRLRGNWLGLVGLLRLVHTYKVGIVRHHAKAVVSIYLISLRFVLVLECVHGLFQVMGGEHAFGPEYNLLTAVVIKMALFVHFVKI